MFKKITSVFNNKSKKEDKKSNNEMSEFESTIIMEDIDGIVEDVINEMSGGVLENETVAYVKDFLDGFEWLEKATTKVKEQSSKAINAVTTEETRNKITTKINSLKTILSEEESNQEKFDKLKALKDSNDQLVRDLRTDEEIHNQKMVLLKAEFERTNSEEELEEVNEIYEDNVELKEELLEDFSEYNKISSEMSALEIKLEKLLELEADKTEELSKFTFKQELKLKGMSFLNKYVKRTGLATGLGLISDIMSRTNIDSLNEMSEKINNLAVIMAHGESESYDYSQKLLESDKLIVEMQQTKAILMTNRNKILNNYNKLLNPDYVAEDLEIENLNPPKNRSIELVEKNPFKAYVESLATRSDVNYMNYGIAKLDVFVKYTFKKEETLLTKYTNYFKEIKEKTKTTEKMFIDSDKELEENNIILKKHEVEQLRQMDQLIERKLNHSQENKVEQNNTNDNIEQEQRKKDVVVNNEEKEGKHENVIKNIEPISLLGLLQEEKNKKNKGSDNQIQRAI